MNRMTQFLAILMAILLLTACSTGEKKTGEIDPVEESAMMSGAQGSQGVQTGDYSELPLDNNPNQNKPAESENDGKEQLQTSEGAQPAGSEASPKETQGENTAPQLMNIDYEPYLAALSLKALSLEYPDFRLDGIYFTSIVDMSLKAKSEGLYVCFQNGGESLTVQVLPLQDERKESMTRDIFADQVGYATFDLVQSMPDGFERMNEENFVSLLSELMGIMILQH